MKNRMLAYHVDLKRPMWRLDYLRDRVRDLASWGFNTVVLELENKFRFERHPTISHPEAPSCEAMAGLVEACRLEGVDVIPLVQSLGHAEYVLSKPAYATLRDAPDNSDQYDPLSGDAQRLIIDLIDEVIEVMKPRQYFHMGGDETWGLGKSPRCAEVVKEIGIGGLYLRHMLPLFEHLHHRGLRPVIWADIVLSHPEIIPRLPSYVVLMDWDYWTREERPKSIIVWGGDQKTGRNAMVTWAEYQTLNHPGLKQYLEPFAVDEQTHRDGTFRSFYCVDALKAMGFDVMTASAERFSCVKTGIPLHVTHMANCFHSVRKGVTFGLGAVVTSWAVRHCHPEVLLPATYAASQASRGWKTYDFEELCLAFTLDYYGVAMPEFGTALVKAGVPFRLAEAHAILAAGKSWRQGLDPMPEEMQRWRPDLTELIQDYTEARDSFIAMRDRAKTHAHNLDFWIEGIELDLFYARYMHAAEEGVLVRQAKELLAELDILREKSRTLLMESYMAQGVNAELNQRYGFHQDYLCGIQTTVAHRRLRV